MANHAYSPRALEYWFSKAVIDWEPFFSTEELTLGRSLYRKNAISHIEITNAQAIFSTKKDRIITYSIVEWLENGGLSLRASTTDTVISRPIAVAGLYELEELIADEISPINEIDEKDVLKKKQEEKALAEVEKANAPPEKEAHKGSLIFKYTSKGLSFSLLPNSDSFVQRGNLIKATGLARKSLFKHLPKNNTFLLEDIASVIHFITENLPSWEEIFDIELDENCKLLKKGAQKIAVSATTKTEKGNRLKVDWLFKSGGKNIPSPQVLKLFKSAQHTAFIPSVGIVQLDDNDVSTLSHWQLIKNFATDDSFPRYLLFSIFNKDSINLKINKSLEDWKQGILKPKAVRKKLPTFLRDYQAQGVKWLIRLCEAECHPLVADEMGLGKTVQILTLLDKRPIKSLPNLVVCPSSVIPVWKSEINKFYPNIKINTLHSKTPFTKSKTPCLWLASYTQLRRHKHLLADIKFGYAILDEAQYIKNPDAKSTQACFNIQATHRIALTGTPIENSFLDLWTIFRFLMPGLLGHRRFFEQQLENDKEATFAKVQSQISPFILRRLKAVVASELPEKLEIDLTCPMTEKQQSEYDLITSGAFEKLDNNLSEIKNKQSTALFALLTRLRQASCDPGLLPWSNADTIHSGKIQQLIVKLQEVINSGHKAVIFSQFVTFLNRIKKVIKHEFPTCRIHELTGKTKDRERPVQQFQKEDGHGVMLTSLKAGGTGITLTKADYVFLMDPWWNPAVENQAIDRVHRIGQKNTVTVYRLYSIGTIEDHIRNLKKDKSELFNNVIGEIPDLSNFKDHFQTLEDLLGKK